RTPRKAFPVRGDPAARGAIGTRKVSTATALTREHVAISRGINPPGSIPKLHVAVLRSSFQHRQGAIDAFAEAGDFDHLEGFNAVGCIQEVAAENVHGAPGEERYV